MCQLKKLKSSWIKTALDDPGALEKDSNKDTTCQPNH